MSLKPSPSKFVKITKDIINIRTNNESLKDEDEETVLGFIENRTVFGETSSGDQFHNHQWTRIQNYLRQSYVSNDHCDVKIIVSDGSVAVNRLMVILLFPDVLHIFDDDLESVIVPDYHLHQMKKFIEQLLNIHDTAKCMRSENITNKASKISIVNDGKVQHICQICDTKFENMYNLVTHEVEHHKEQQEKVPLQTEFDPPVKCLKCKIEMVSARVLNEHKCTQTRYNPTKCSSCSKILVNKSQMTNHVCAAKDNSKKTLSESLSCQSCSKVFATLRRTLVHEVEDCNNLSRKLPPDLKMKIFDCDKCDKHFVLRKNFESHMETHQSSDIENIDPENNIKSEPCNVVGKDKEIAIALGQLKELDAKSWECLKCDKRFSTKVACHEHEVLVHGDVTNVDNYYKCEYCPKLFMNKTILENHLTTHTGDRKHQCHLCPEQFKTAGNLTSHLATRHEVIETGLEKKYQCKFCPRTFRFPAQISQHERRHTKEKPFKCELCGKCFSVKCNLKAHMETHKSLSERSYKCDQCEHRATSLPLLKLHQHSHTGERPFICELCGESYKRPHNLRRHKKTMCKLRVGAKIPENQMEMDEEDEEIYERIETVVVQCEDEGDIIIETEQYQKSNKMFTDDNTAYILTDTSKVVVQEENVQENENVVEEGIVEEDGIKYETPIILM